MDCVTDDNDVFIGYSADLSFSTVIVHFIASMLFQNNILVEKSKILLKQSEIRREKNNYLWQVDELSLRGEWSGSDSDHSIKKTLFDNESGKIIWHCLLPSSKVSLDIDGTELKGIGYLEHLEMTIKPWKLPFKELRWGRFIADGQNLVWIDWRNGLNKSFIFSNGIEIENGQVSDDSIELENSTKLTITDKKVIRERELSNSIINKIPILKNLPQFNMLKVVET